MFLTILFLLLRPPLHKQAKRGQELVQHLGVPSRDLLEDGPPPRRLARLGALAQDHHLGLVLLAVHGGVIDLGRFVPALQGWERRLAVRQAEEVVGQLLGTGFLARAEEGVVRAQQDDNVEGVRGVALPGPVPRVGQVEVPKVGFLLGVIVGGGPRAGGGLGALGEEDVVDEVDDGELVLLVRLLVASLGPGGRVDAVRLGDGRDERVRVGPEDGRQGLDERLVEVVRAVAEDGDVHDHAVLLAVAEEGRLAPRAGAGEEGGEVGGAGEARVRRDRLDDVAVVVGVEGQGDGGEFGSEGLGGEGEEGLDLFGGRAVGEAQGGGGGGEGGVGDGEGQGLDQGVAAQGDEAGKEGLVGLQVDEARGGAHAAPQEGDAGRVAAKGPDVLLDPAQGEFLVVEAIVGQEARVAQGGRVEKAKRAKAVAGKKRSQSALCPSHQKRGKRRRPT